MLLKVHLLMADWPHGPPSPSPVSISASAASNETVSEVSTGSMSLRPTFSRASSTRRLVPSSSEPWVWVGPRSRGFSLFFLCLFLFYIKFVLCTVFVPLPLAKVRQFMSLLLGVLTVATGRNSQQTIRIAGLPL